MTHEEYNIQWLPTDRIWRPDSFNCRSDFMLSEVEDLSKSIADIGRLLTPLIVQPMSDVAESTGIGSALNGAWGSIRPGHQYTYRLISGYRRFSAITVFLKWPEAPCQILYGLNEQQARLINLVENLERKDLNPFEEAVGIRNAYPDGLPSLRDIAADVKKDKTWVGDRLRILRLPDEVQHMVASRRVSLTDIEIILKYEDEDTQIKAANELAGAKMPKGCRSKPVAKALQKPMRHRRPTEINEKIEHLITLGVDVSGRRMAAWCAGGISDDDLEADIQCEVGLLAQSKN